MDNFYNTEQEIYNQGFYSPVALAAIMGNVRAENDTADYKRKQDGGPGYGLYQFDFHRPYYERWLKANKRLDSPESQTLYMAENIKGNKLKGAGDGTKEPRTLNVMGKGLAADVRRMFDSGNVREATTLFMKNFENPADQSSGKIKERGDYATAWIDNYLQNKKLTEAEMVLKTIHKKAQERAKKKARAT